MTLALSDVILKIMRDKETFFKYYRTIAKNNFIGYETKKTLQIWGEWFKENEDRVKLDESILNWAMLAHKFTALDSMRDTFKFNVKTALEGDNSELKANFINRFTIETAAQQMKELTDKYYAGELVDLQRELKEIEKCLAKDLNKGNGINFVEVTEENIFKSTWAGNGFKWRVRELNKAMRPLAPGDFGIVAGRPDQGKTSFVASEIINFAEQTERPIIWFNNESTGDRILRRCFQAALNADKNELDKIAAEGSLISKYAECVGGKNKVLVFDIHDKTNDDVEDIIEEYKPSVVVFDMIDNIKFAGQLANGGNRTDQILESMYQWGRIMAVKHDFAGIALSQLSAEAEGLRWPLLSMLKDSRTGKQGACDFAIYIGTDPNMPDSRFLSTPKNKLENEVRDCRAEVIFDRHRSRYISQEDYNSTAQVDDDDIPF